MIAGAVAAGRGELSFASLLVTAFAAACLGSATGYEVGRRGGRWLLRRFARDDRLARLEARFRRSDAALVALGRFVDGLRQTAGLAAGAFEMSPTRFHLWNLAGAALWTGVFGAGAYLLGEDLGGLAARLHHARTPLLFVTLGALVVGVGWLVSRRGVPSPRP